MTAHPEADAETEEALKWYENQSFQAADNFLSELDHARAWIADHPLSGHPVHQNYRRRNLKRFPYAIIYRPKGDSIYVIAVIHEKRLPLYWLHRISDDQE